LFILFFRNKPFKPELRSTLIRAIAATLTGLGVSWLLGLIPLPAGGMLLNLIIKSMILFLSFLAIIPWLVPEIKDLLNT
jgi:hypothetical protein